MADGLNDALALIQRIQNHFAANGWQPLLQIKVNGLRTLSYDKLEQLVPKVLSASDRVAAVTAILEAVIPGNEADAVWYCFPAAVKWRVRSGGHFQFLMRQGDTTDGQYRADSFQRG
jgi:hypothetical protein